MDVGRKRDLSEPVRHRHDRLVLRGGEPHMRRAVGIARDDLAGERAAGIREAGADRQFSARANQATPDVVADFHRAEQEAFNPPPGRALRVQPGGKHGGVVAKQRVAGAKELRQVAEDRVGERAGGAVDDQQPGAIALRGGSLSDEAGWQVIVEKIGGQRRHAANEGLRSPGARVSSAPYARANIAQLVEQRFRKAWVVGSNPTVGSSSIGVRP